MVTFIIILIIIQLYVNKPIEFENALQQKGIAEHILHVEDLGKQRIVFYKNYLDSENKQGLAAGIFEQDNAGNWSFSTGGGWLYTYTPSFTWNTQWTRTSTLDEWNRIEVLFGYATDPNINRVGVLIGGNEIEATLFEPENWNSFWFSIIILEDILDIEEIKAYSIYDEVLYTITFP